MCVHLKSSPRNRLKKQLKYHDSFRRDVSICIAALTQRTSNCRATRTDNEYQFKRSKKADRPEVPWNPLKGEKPINLVLTWYLIILKMSLALLAFCPAIKWRCVVTLQVHQKGIRSGWQEFVNGSKVLIPAGGCNRRRYLPSSHTFTAVGRDNPTQLNP